MNEGMQKFVIKKVDELKKEEQGKFMLFYAIIPKELHGHIIAMAKAQKVMDLYGNSRIDKDKDSELFETLKDKGVYFKDVDNKQILMCSLNIPMIAMAGLIELLNLKNEEEYNKLSGVPFSQPNIIQEIISVTEEMEHRDGEKNTFDKKVRTFLKTSITSSVLGNRESIIEMSFGAVGNEDDDMKKIFDSGLRKALSMYGIGKLPIQSTPYSDNELFNEFREFYIQKKRK